MLYIGDSDTNNIYIYIYIYCIAGMFGRDKV